MKLIKFGGSSLKDANGFLKIADIIKKEDEKIIVILSGVNGVTDTIQEYLKYKKYDEIAIQKIIQQIKRLHNKIASKSISDIAVLKKVQFQLNTKIEKLEKLLRGIYYIEELTDKTKDLIISYGERLSVLILAGVLIDQNLKAEALEADKIGIITNGNFGDAVVNPKEISKNLKKTIYPLIKQDIIPIITGFFGCDNNGYTTIFGRDGSDYSASIIANALDVDRVELWKNTDGFRSADPKKIKETNLIEKLSYSEAAELSYFGAKILHPRTVEPLKEKNIKLIIKNIKNPVGKGTEISNLYKMDKSKIKSLAYNNNIASLKIFGPGIGYKPGVLSEITRLLNTNKTNIKSVITSQTCINILLDKKDLITSKNLLEEKRIDTIEKIETKDDIALIAVVGYNIAKKYGIAADIFKSISKKQINIESISAGASNSAYYFIIKNIHLDIVLQTVHDDIFFETKTLKPELAI